MNKNKLKLATGLICGVLLLPSVGHAANAVQLNDKSVLFTIDFGFTEAAFPQSVPIAAKYGVKYEDRVDTVGFNIESANTVQPELEKVSALVLSKSPVEGTRYGIATSTEAKFKLLIIATFAEAISNDLAAKITKLPYFIEERRTTVHQNQLDEIEPAVFDLK